MASGVPALTPKIGVVTKGSQVRLSLALNFFFAAWIGGELTRDAIDSPASFGVSK